jgi:hydrogenase nickel incorporation protein HypB
VKIPVVHKILEANDAIAASLREAFDNRGLYVFNLLGSPGAGKTSLLEKTLELADGSLRIGVIEGDLATELDAQRVARHDAPVVQVNTGGNCHLDAAMVRQALDHLDTSNLDVLAIENVGNLVCPAAWDLGEREKIVVSSVPEGDDKPAKYPSMFSGSAAVILNKCDLLPYVAFSVERFEEHLRSVNPEAPLMQISCTTGEGFESWLAWLRSRIRR